MNFRGETRRNDTHQSTTDPDARLAKKGPGREAKLSYAAHLLIENRHGLIVDTAVTSADGYAEVEAAIIMLGELPQGQRITVGADKGYDTQRFVAACRLMGITPHVAQKQSVHRDRRPDHADCGLRSESAPAQADRGSLRLDEDNRPVAEAPSSRRATGRLDLHLHGGCVQLGSVANVDGGAGVKPTSAPAPHGRRAVA